MTIPTYTDDVPFVTTEQMIEVDRAMMEDYRIELMQMMENAGRNLAHLARERFFGGDPQGKRVIVSGGHRWQWWRRVGMCPTAAQLWSTGTDFHCQAR